MYDNSVLIGFLKTNLELNFRNNRIFDLEVIDYHEEEDLARWKVQARKHELSVDVVIEFHPGEKRIAMHAGHDESLTQSFGDQDEILIRIELFYFNKRFDYFYPQALSDATRNRIILENIVKICRFVETKLLAGKLKNCNVVWNDVHLMCEFMYEGQIRGVAHNSWFLNLEYYPQLHSLNESYFISCDGMGPADEGFEQEVKSLNEAMSIVESRLEDLPI